MSVFFGFRDPELLHAKLGDIFAEGVGQRFRLKGHLDIGHGRVVLGHAHIGQGEEAFLPLKALESRIHKGAGDFPGPVRTEVEEYHRIPGADLSAAGTHGRHHEFVGNLLGVAVGHRLHRALCLDALAVNHGGIGLFHTVPAVVAVHGVVAAHYRSDFAHADFLQLIGAFLHIILAGGGRYVAAVQQSVDIHILQAAALSQLHDGIEVGVMAVDAAVGQQADEMEGLAVVQRVVDGV